MKQLQELYEELHVAGLSMPLSFVIPSFLRIKGEIPYNERTAYITPLSIAPRDFVPTDKLLDPSAIFAIDKITLIQTSNLDIYNVNDFIDPKFIHSFLRIYVNNLQIAELAFEVYNKGVCQVTTPCWIILKGYTNIRIDLICPEPFTELTMRTFNLIMEGYLTYDRTQEVGSTEKAATE